ncbi:MAG: GNAT family N-acetyltransferase [Candidatus Methylacidiphilales bacterium]
MNTSCHAVSPSTDTTAAATRYSFRLATTPEEVQAAQRLRFQIFNLELNEGLAASYAIERDVDVFDSCCDHLIVVAETCEGPALQVVGTYRLQTGMIASLHHGYYSAQEFDFAPYEPLRAELLELGRACVHPDHRNFSVLALLWKGIAVYAKERNCRYLIGCSSITSQDPRIGAAVYNSLGERHMCPEPLRTRPLPAYAFPLDIEAEPETTDHALASSPEPPRLLLAYLMLGAKLCSPPAIDREFGTIDLLTMLDLDSVSPAIKSRLFL